MKAGNGDVVFGKAQKDLQAGMDAIAELQKTKPIDEGMEAIRRKLDSTPPPEPPGMEMYHGSPDQNISKFKGQAFFTKDPEVARQYSKGNIAASATGADQNGAAVYKVKVNPDKVLDFREPGAWEDYEARRKEFNSKLTDPDEFMPKADSLRDSNTGLPSYGRARTLLDMYPEHDAIWFNEGTQGESLLMRDASGKVHIVGKADPQDMKFKSPQTAAPSDEGMKPWDAKRIKAETGVEQAHDELMGLLGSKGKLSSAKLAKALKSDDRDAVVEALQKYHQAGKDLAAFHEELAQAGASGSEGLAGKTKEQVDQLMEVQGAMKAGIAKSEGKKATDEVLKTGLAYGVAEHFGHMLLGKAYVTAKVAGKLVEMLPADFKAARLAQLARVAQGVEDHLDRVAKASAAGGTGKYAAPVASLLTVDEYRKLRDDVNNKVSNPQLALDHLHEKAGVVNEFAPDTYAQMGIQYGTQLQAMAQALQGPTLQGPYSPQYMPSATELQKASTAVAIVKDPRVAEAKIAKGTITPSEAKVYSMAHGPRAAALSAKVAGGLKQGMAQDRDTLKAMTGVAIMGLGAPRTSYSQPMLQRVQGFYSQRDAQQGGPGSRGGLGSRGGTGGAKALTASQAISLPGQRVANRPVK